MFLASMAKMVPEMLVEAEVTTANKQCSRVRKQRRQSRNSDLSMTSGTRDLAEETVAT